MTTHSIQPIGSGIAVRLGAGASLLEALARSSRALARRTIAATGRVLAWLKICREYHKAATSYEELRGLSDAELARRGLVRTNLARDLCETCGSRSQN